MDRFTPCLLLALCSLPVHAAKAPPPAVASTANDAAFAAAASVVDRFSAALKAGDFATVGALLDARVLILESGGAEHSREEYLGRHAIADAAFLGGADVRMIARTGGAQGDLAWVATEAAITPPAGSDSPAVIATESMVLQRAAVGWRIVHIHWSSQPQARGGA